MFFIHDSYVRSVRRYCFVRNYAEVPVQLEIVILQYIGWCVLVVWTVVFNQFSLLLLLLFCIDGESYIVLVQTIESDFEIGNILKDTSMIEEKKR
jgi:hypothetical protein